MGNKSNKESESYSYQQMMQAQQQQPPMMPMQQISMPQYPTPFVNQQIPVQQMVNPLSYPINPVQLQPAMMPNDMLGQSWMNQFVQQQQPMMPPQPLQFPQMMVPPSLQHMPPQAPVMPIEAFPLNQQVLNNQSRCSLGPGGWSNQMRQPPIKVSNFPSIPRQF